MKIIRHQIPIQRPFTRQDGSKNRHIKGLYSGCKENHFSSLPFGQAEASIYQTRRHFNQPQKLFVLLLFKFLIKHHLPIGQVKNRIHQPDSKIHQPRAIGQYFLCKLIFYGSTKIGFLIFQNNRVSFASAFFFSLVQIKYRMFCKFRILVYSIYSVFQNIPSIPPLRSVIPSVRLSTEQGHPTVTYYALAGYHNLANFAIFYALINGRCNKQDN